MHWGSAVLPHLDAGFGFGAALLASAKPATALPSVANCWVWPSFACTASGNATISIFGSMVGIFLGAFAVRQAYIYKTESDRQLAELDKATDNLSATALGISSKAEEIADHLRHKIVSVGEAIAYAYRMLEDIEEYCKRKARGEPIGVEVYYINIVWCFGAVHEVNETVKENYERQREKLNIDLKYDALVRSFPDTLRKLTKKCTAKVTLLAPDQLDEKFFGVLSESPPYNLVENQPAFFDSIEMERHWRDMLDKTSTNYAKYLPFQMLTARAVRSDGTVEMARSLVLAVGTTSIGKGLGEPKQQSMANGYYTADSHYAEIDVQIAKSIWEEAENRKVATSSV